jgi:hypothetical protein
MQIMKRRGGRGRVTHMFFRLRGKGEGATTIETDY